MLPVWLIKFAFHLLYYQFAWTYDLVAWAVSWGQWAAWRRLALKFLQPASTLELAYGTGAFFMELHQRGYQPIGIDLSPYMARLAHRRLQRQQLAGILCQAKAQKLPFPDHHFSNIVATFPTDYIFEIDTLQEINRVLRPQGRLVVVLEGQLRGPWPIQPFLVWLYQITGQHREPSPAPILPIQTLRGQWHWAEEHGAAAWLFVAEKQ